MPFACAYCRRPLPEGTHPFTLRMDFFPAIEPSLTLSEEDIEGDARAELERLMEKMAAMDDAQAREQEKLVFTRHEYVLCRRCRDRLVARLERLDQAGQAPPPPEP